MEFTIRLERDVGRRGTLILVEALMQDVMVRQDADKRTLLGLLQGAVAKAVETWEKGAR